MLMRQIRRSIDDLNAYGAMSNGDFVRHDGEIVHCEAFAAWGEELSFLLGVIDELQRELNNERYDMAEMTVNWGMEHVNDKCLDFVLVKSAARRLCDKLRETPAYADDVAELDKLLNEVEDHPGSVVGTPPIGGDILFVCPHCGSNRFRVVNDSGDQHCDQCGTHYRRRDMTPEEIAERYGIPLDVVKENTNPGYW